jgi:hypothetical protein
MKSRHRNPGQALTEFALIFPIFLLLLFAIITFGLYVFYSQQLTNAAREAARYAAIHSSSASCPTVSQLNPTGTQKALRYWRCDPPELGWPKLTAAGRSAIYGISPNLVYFSACWSGYVDPSVFPAMTDASPEMPGAAHQDCTMNRINPHTATDALPCPPAPTIASAYGRDGRRADGDDTSSSLAAVGTFHYPTTVTVYACFKWSPPFAGLLFMPSQITMRAVISEALQRQQ